MNRPDLTILPPVDYDTRLNLYDAFRDGRCLYEARAATTSWLSRFASSCQHRIAIASVALCIFLVVYFAIEFTR